MLCLANIELDGIGRGGHKRGHGPREILDTSEEARLVEEAVVDRDIEAAASLRIEEPIQACRFHGEEMRWTATKARRRRALGDVVSGVSLTHASKFSQPANDAAARAPYLSVCVTRNVFAARGSRLLDRSIGKIRRGTSFFGFDAGGTEHVARVTARYPHQNCRSRRGTACFSRHGKLSAYNSVYQVARFA